jgi:hypothetical protein
VGAARSLREDVMNIPPAQAPALERDIDANRRGQLSPSQSEVVKSLSGLTGCSTFALPLFGSIFGLSLGLTLVKLAFSTRGLEAFGTGAVGVAVVAGTVVAAMRWWKKVPPPKYPTNGTVTAIEGTVAWASVPSRVWQSRSAWTPHDATGLPLTSTAVGPWLPPGPWRFYLYGDQIVGAESPLDRSATWSNTQTVDLMRSTSATTPLPATPLPVGDPEALLKILGDVVGFTPDELAYHRRGQLAPHQGTGDVLRIEGMLAAAWTVRGRSCSYHWEVGGEKFDVPAAWMTAAPPGVFYRVYVHARARRPLSLEPATLGERPPYRG